MTTVDRNPVLGFSRQARYFPRNPVLVYEGQELDYGQFHGQVRRMATALEDFGVGRGDRVAYLGLNSTTFLTTMLAAWWIGAVFEPFNLSGR